RGGGASSGSAGSGWSRAPAPEPERSHRSGRRTTSAAATRSGRLRRSSLLPSSPPPGAGTVRKSSISHLRSLSSSCFPPLASVWSRSSSRITLGNAFIASRGYAAPETRETYAQARALAADLGDAATHLLPVPYGLWNNALVDRQARRRLRTRKHLPPAGRAACRRRSRRGPASGRLVAVLPRT